ncbi:RNA polymerase sigma factor sigC [Argentina anserina]|uniref:RNA polymerase sigma factor sigC n=1 Tax=Argentina anserina TaxID=57926 RepID=UPI00217644F2|nr:RNA polymerase sigma factor sigC [Potentilla anserina]
MDIFLVTPRGFNGLYCSSTFVPRKTMGLGFRLNLKCGFHVHNSHWQTNSPSKLSSTSVRGREGCFSSARLSFLSVISEECEISSKDPLKAYTCPSASAQLVDDDFSEMEEKMNIRRISKSGSLTMIDDKEHSFMSSAGLRTSHFTLLLQNLNVLEETFADSNVLQLEKEIIMQLGRLGALKLFDICLSRTLKTSSFIYLSDIPTEPIEENKIERKNIVRSGKKEERKSRKRPPDSLPLKPMKEGFKKPIPSSVRKASNSRSRRVMMAKNEAEMSVGVKVIADLERLKATLEKDTGKVPSLRCWAEAAGVDEKVLQQQLQFGWYCQDELVRSTRSLVLYLARNYRGLGVALDDLLQAGYMGLLQGAERFDPSRGYRFSTYVQYWIRKSMSRLVAQHARGIKIPNTLSKAINQIQKARKVNYNSHMKYPDDEAIAKITGLSLAKIRSASRCLRVVGSVDHKIWECSAGTYMEFTPDIAVESPEESVMRQHMKNDIHDLLEGLNSREKQVLALRYGLNYCNPKSLEEIGRLFHVSKEWIRKIEKNALTKLRDEETNKNLIHYLKQW